MFDVEALTRWAGNFEPLPPTAARLVVLEERKADSRQLVEAVMLDPVLTLRVLRLANASLGSAQVQFASVNEVIVAVGNGGVLGMALGDRARGAPFVPARKPAVGTRSWCHAVTTAVAARDLAKAAGLEQLANQAFAAGLLHDLGRAAARDFFSAAESRALDRAEIYGGLRRHRAEEKLLDFDHAALGAQIAESWALPASLVRALRHHHAAAPEGDPLADLVCLGNALAHWLDADPGRGLYEEETAALGRLGMEQELFETIFFRTGRTAVQILLAYGIDPAAPRFGPRRKLASPALA